ncbi:MAG: metalloregulator ArsR/SmtB family transcription factor [Anaerovorax sp.]
MEKKMNGDMCGSGKEHMPGADELYELSELFKSLADQTRLKILFALSKEDLCVCDIAALLEMSQSAISHQLRVLRNVRLVKYTKKGKAAYYALDDHHVKNIFEQGLEHVGHARVQDIEVGGK